LRRYYFGTKYLIGSQQLSSHEKANIRTYCQAYEKSYQQTHSATV
jgi:hypothetical protein